MKRKSTVGGKIKQQNWQRADDQLDSAKILLAENVDSIKELIINRSGGVKVIAFLMKKSMERLVPVAEEIGVDATYNTNQSNMELVSVLAQHDGVGFPVAYMLMTATNEIKPHVKRRTTPPFFSHPNLLPIETENNEIGNIEDNIEDDDQYLEYGRWQTI